MISILKLILVDVVIAAGKKIITEITEPTPTDKKGKER
jgi:hypothetical protein